MNNTLYTALGLVGLAIIGFGAYMVWPSPPGSSSPYAQDEPGSIYSDSTVTSEPRATPVARKLVVIGNDGIGISVKDFINNGETVADTINPGSYYLAGSVGYCLGDGTCPAGAKSEQFTVSYSRQKDLFIVSILAEPLAESRALAERFVADRLGIGGNQMCRLNYQVSVTSGINEFYSGRNLGWSFCPGAVILQ
jgi:hypothetical protein